MTLLIIIPEPRGQKLAEILREKKPDADIRLWPDVGNAEDISFIVTWKAPTGEYSKYPNLKVVASLGAGVEQLVNDPSLPPSVRLTRFADESLNQDMADYIAGVVLSRRLHLIDYREYQAARHWAPKPPEQGRQVTLLGLGEIGSYVGTYLTKLGFSVSGWSRSEKNIPGVKSYHGPEMLGTAVAEADYIVCLLPITEETVGILNADLFSKCKKGVFLINVGRGEHLVEDDLFDALQQGAVCGACLDVFRTEPLPDDHPFWQHPRIWVTPHIASVTAIDRLAHVVAENYSRHQKGDALLHQVDPDQGY